MTSYSTRSYYERAAAKELYAAFRVQKKPTATRCVRCGTLNYFRDRYKVCHACKVKQKVGKK